MENKIKHLEMIEAIIERMANNSFLLKGWAVTLIVGVFALVDKEYEQAYLLIIYVPLILFWFLDSYYLYLEKKYRMLYECVRQKKEEEIDFDMNIKSCKICFCECLFSISEGLYYIPTIAIMAFIMKLI